MIHILNYCLFTVVVFAVLLRFFWPGLVPLAGERRIVNAESLERCCRGLCVLRNLSRWRSLCSLVLINPWLTQAVVIWVMTSKRLECHVGLHISPTYRRMQEAVESDEATSWQTFVRPDPCLTLVPVTCDNPFYSPDGPTVGRLGNLTKCLPRCCYRSFSQLFYF